MSDDNSESRIVELEKKIEMMEEQMARKEQMMEEQMVRKDQMLAKKDQQIDKLTELYTAAIKQIQGLTAELQEAKSIVSVAVAKSIGAKPDKKGNRNTKSNKKSKGPSVHKRTSLKRPEIIDVEETADPHTCGNCGSSNLS